jgi:outer membrane lipoprotein-sorting protein
MSKLRSLSLALVILLAGSACGLSSAAEANPSPAPTEAPSIPVSINEGLASLDSYHLTYSNDVFDSQTQQRSEMTLVVARDSASDASYTRSESRSSSGEGAEVSEDVQEQYIIGDQMCMVAADGVEASPVGEITQAVSDLMSQVIVFQPLIENPELVGEDVVNGVPVRQYTFDVRSVGSTSEVEVARSDGSYAVAVDGDYLVQYLLDLELRTGAEGDPEAQYATFHVEYGLDDINQPVEIAFPAECPVVAPPAE